MLTQNKEEVLRRLQAIDPDRQRPESVFAELCSVCALLAQELEPSIPSGKEGIIDESVLDAAFNLARTAEGVSRALRATASLGLLAKDLRVDWDAFLEDATSLSEENDALCSRLGRLIAEGAPVPDRERVEEELHALERQSEACEGLRQLLAPLEPGSETLPGRPLDASDALIEMLAAWRVGVLQNADQLAETLDRHRIVLREVIRSIGIVETARRFSGDMECFSGAASRSSITPAGDEGACPDERRTGEKPLPIDESSEKRRSLQPLFEEVESEWRSGNWLAVLGLYDRIIDIDADNRRARRERPLALCCLVETLVVAPTTDQAFFTPIGREFDPRRAAERLERSDVESLVGMPTPPWDDESLKEALWRPLSLRLHTFDPGEQRYLGEFLKALL